MRLPRARTDKRAIYVPHSIHLSTERLDPSKRFDTWREIYGRDIVNVDIEALNDASYCAEMRIQPLPGIVLAETQSASRHQTTREPAADAQDTVLVAMALRGQTQISRLGRGMRADVGPSIVLSGSEPGVVTLPAGCRSLTLRIDRNLLAPLIPNLGAHFAMTLANDNPTHRLLVQYLGILRSADELGQPALATSIATHLVDLVALSLTGEHGGRLQTRRSVRDARLRTIKAKILAWLGRHDLNTDLIAAHHGISARYVRKLFETEGTSFTAFVLGERLARAHRRLCDRQSMAYTIGAIAFESGFGDLSYFNQTFKRTFGATPTDVRRDAQSKLR